MVCYGVDVGITGAIAVTVNGRLMDVADLPAHVVSAGTVKRQLDPAGLASTIRGWRAQYGVDAEMAVIERVGSMPGQGVASVFSLGHSLGAVQGALAALGVPSTLVAPQTWKRSFGLGKDKSASQAEASRLFPQHAGRWALVKHHNRAEAVLLAAYGWKEAA
jgi:crossover junction endodeoxyribonuclease RuvC